MYLFFQGREDPLYSEAGGLLSPETPLFPPALLRVPTLRTGVGGKFFLRRRFRGLGEGAKRAFSRFGEGNEPSAVWEGRGIWRAGDGAKRAFSRFGGETSLRPFGIVGEVKTGLRRFVFFGGRCVWRGWRRRGGGLGLWDEPDFLAGRQKRPSVSGPWKAGGAWGLLFRKWVLMVIGFRLKIKKNPAFWAGCREL